MNMRILVFFGISLLFLSSKSAETIDLSGKITDNALIKEVKIRNLENNSKVLSAVTLTGSEFSFAIGLKNQTVLKVETNDYGVSELLFFYEPGLVYTVKIKNKDAIILAPENSLQEEYNILLKELTPLNEKLTKVSRDTIMSFAELDVLSTQYYHNIIKLQTEHITKHPKSYVSLYLLKELVRTEALSYHQLNTFYNIVNNDAHQGTGMLGFIADKIESLNESRIIGKFAPEFALKNPDNNTFTPADFKGNYTLIDFWAGWCAPCRVANKKIIPLYNKYKEKGFHIVSISFDDTRESWLKAINDDQLPWVQLSDLKGFNKSPIKALYNINHLPTTYMVSPEGKIVDQNLTVDELEKLLEEIYKY